MSGVQPARGCCGAAYELTPPGPEGGGLTETVVHTFTGSPDGGGPEAALTVGPGEVLYGTTLYGGSGSALLVHSQTGRAVEPYSS